jgi:energy-coupling factor transport system substrate-specific component
LKGLSNFRAKVKDILDGQRLFSTHELVVVGIFAAGSRATTLMVALIGGGMNPLTMVVRSAVHSALLVVLLAKVSRTGALTMANLVGGLLAFFLMGQAMVALPAIIAGTLAVEILIRALGGLEKRPALGALAVALSEFFTRMINVGVSYLTFREQPAMIIMVLVITAVSYFGILLGLFGGVSMTRELKHAGLIG